MPRQLAARASIRAAAAALPRWSIGNGNAAAGGGNALGGNAARVFPATSHTPHHAATEHASEVDEVGRTDQQTDDLNG